MIGATEIKTTYHRLGLKGLPKRVIVYKHALKNASDPVVTFIAPSSSRSLLGGRSGGERSFALARRWRRLVVDSIFAATYPMASGDRAVLFADICV